MRHTQCVIDKFSATVEDNATISSITLAELEFGVCNSGAYEKNRAKLLLFLPLVDVLPFDAAAAVEYGMIRADLQKKGMVIGSLDMLIAAHAKSQNLTIITGNTDEFNRVTGLDVENWLI